MAGPFSVEGQVPGSPVWSVDAVGNTVQSKNLTVAGTVFSAGPVLTTGQLVAGTGGINTSVTAASTILSTLSIGNQQTSGTQLPDTTRDYMCYVTTVGGGGGNTLTIGPNSTATTATIFANATITTVASIPISWRQPAGWFVMFNGTATLGVQSGIPC